MSSTTFPIANASSISTIKSSEISRGWRLAGMTLLATRVVQGFIYWGGGSRRFIYAPSKLNAWGGHSWMANKFQTAMPGALFGTDHVISFLLQHFYLLYTSVILFSAAELIVGAMLMIGLCARFAALLSMGFSVLLMAMFGWQGATCIDEWTMAACNLAMGTTLLLGGASAYSVDNVLLRRNPVLADRVWFRWICGSLPLPLDDRNFCRFSLALFVFTIIYNVGTYSYYRGSVVTAFHGGPVSPTAHHVTLAAGRILPDGHVHVHAYLDAGTPEAPLHLVQAELVGTDEKTILVIWDAKALSHLTKADFANDYAYNRFEPGPFGIRAAMGAKATITLPLPTGFARLPNGTVLKLTDVDGRSFAIRLQDKKQ